LSFQVSAAGSGGCDEGEGEDEAEHVVESDRQKD
jgi:hypothetical protein